MQVSIRYVLGCNVIPSSSYLTRPSLLSPCPSTIAPERTEMTQERIFPSRPPVGRHSAAILRLCRTGCLQLSGAGDRNTTAWMVG